jgi:hypothetical protein
LGEWENMGQMIQWSRCSTIWEYFMLELVAELVSELELAKRQT